MIIIHIFHPLSSFFCLPVENKLLGPVRTPPPRALPHAGAPLPAPFGASRGEAFQNRPPALHPDEIPRIGPSCFRLNLCAECHNRPAASKFPFRRRPTAVLRPKAPSPPGANASQMVKKGPDAASCKSDIRFDPLSCFPATAFRRLQACRLTILLYPHPTQRQRASVKNPGRLWPGEKCAHPRIRAARTRDALCRLPSRNLRQSSIVYAAESSPPSTFSVVPVM